MTKQDPSAALQHVFQLALGYMPAISLNIAVKLGVADLLANGPRQIGDIARTVGANEDSLYRMMRALSTVGVFEETGTRSFGQTPASDLLRRDHPASASAMVDWIADPFHFRTYANFMHSIKTGGSAMEFTVGKPPFEYLRDDPEELAIFHAAMVNLTYVCIPAMIEAYDFSKIRKLVDVGGGHGSVVAEILRKNQSMRGILYDLDHVVAGARPILERAGVADRCEIVAGNFFESVPAGGDTYIMKHIIHDWDDEKALTILNNIKSALGSQPDGKLLLLEAVVAGPGQPDMAKWIDLEMMAGPGGRERTREEFQELLSRAGFRLTRVVPTKSPLSVIEALPA